MEIGVVNCSPEESLAFTYGLPHTNTVNYLSQRINDFTQTLTHVPDVVKGMFGDLKTVYDRFFSDESIAKAKQALNATGTDINPAVIKALLSIEALQNASIANQRWVMAEPTLRGMYHKHLVDGYSDTYQDMQPNRIGDWHYDYQRAMDGLIVPDGDDFVCNIYSDEVMPGDMELNIQEQVKIQDTWEYLRHYLSQKKKNLPDPTSASGGFL